MSAATPRFTDAVAPRPTPHRSHRSARTTSVTPLHPHLVLPAEPRARKSGWTLLILPPARKAAPVLSAVVGLRHLLVPLACAVVFLMVVAAGSIRLGVRTHEAMIAPEMTRLQDQLQDAQMRMRVLADTVGSLQMQLSIKAGGVASAGTAGRTTRATSSSSLRPSPGVVLPVGGRISSGFVRGRLHPILGIRRPHRGVDIAASSGTRITAPAPGRVAKVSREMGYGLIVHLDHGGGITTRYAHLRSALVKAGDRVEAGSPIATVGSSGLATSAHLHYEVHVRGQAVDPLRVVVAPTPD